MSAESQGPNAEQIEFWNDSFGPKWVEMQDHLDAMIGPLGRAAMKTAGVRPGERVVDVGCGCGETSLELAEQTGADGRVLGVDISAPMLARARARAAEKGAKAVSFLQADAQTHGFDAGAFDVVFSRFGVMFFDDPPAAFANLRRALVPGGRLVFVCWQGIEGNDWIRIPLIALAQHVPLPPPPEPGTPGPMSLADPERVRGILDAAGFRDVSVAPLVDRLRVGGGGSAEQAAHFVLRIGPAARALGDVDEGIRAEAAQTIRESLADYVSDGLVEMPYAAWIVSARNA